MPPNNTSKCILMIDQDTAFLAMLKVDLTQRKYEVIDTNDADHAFQVLRNQSVDLLISSMTMPGWPGVELLKAIRKEHPSLPIVIHSDNAQVEAAIDCIRSGANDFIAKPFSPSTLATKVENIFQAPRLPSVKTIRRDHDGRILGGYNIVRILGEGTQSIVFLAEKVVDGRKQTVALKIIRPGRLTSAAANDYVRRFVIEADVAMRIQHPNIVRIYDYGIADEENIPFMVMEYVQGQSLRFYIQAERQFNYRQKAKIIRDVADALVAVHAQGVSHRDIKPENIVVDEQQNVKLMDFGIARLPNSELTQTMCLLGTPAYLSPEGFLSAKTDTRADIYSLGATAYEFFLQRRPFSAATFGELAAMVRTEKAVEPRKIDSDFPRTLQLILEKMLKKRPEDRYQTTKEIVADLDRFLDGAQDRTLAGLIRRIGPHDWH